MSAVFIVGTHRLSLQYYLTVGRHAATVFKIVWDGGERAVLMGKIRD